MVGERVTNWQVFFQLLSLVLAPPPLSVEDPSSYFKMLKLIYSLKCAT